MNRYEKQIKRQMEKERRRRRHINRWKKYKGCSLCGYNDCAAALEFHHVDPETKVKGVHAMMTYSLNKIFAEIRKCILICANCHRRIHSEDNDD